MFSRFLNCTNGTKSRKRSHILQEILTIFLFLIFSTTFIVIFSHPVWWLSGKSFILTFGIQKIFVSLKNILKEIRFSFWVKKWPENSIVLCKKCPYPEFFWSVFSQIRTEYGYLLCKSPYSARMRENTDQKTPNTDTFHIV